VIIERPGKIKTPKDSTADYDYIIRIIQYLDYHFGIYFIITTRDFDILFRWWEKQIPLEVITDSIRNVVLRWQVKKKSINGFSNFSYEVKKNFRLFMELNVGDSQRTEKNELYDIQQFLKTFPRAFSLDGAISLLTSSRSNLTLSLLICHPDHDPRN
jgi:hypothetical protein